jgi:hypothetical protein
VGLGGHLVGHVLGASDRAGLKIVINILRALVTDQ